MTQINLKRPKQKVEVKKEDENFLLIESDLSNVPTVILYHFRNRKLAGVSLSSVRVREDMFLFERISLELTKKMGSQKIAIVDDVKNLMNNRAECKVEIWKKDDRIAFVISLFSIEKKNKVKIQERRVIIYDSTSLTAKGLLPKDIYEGLRKTRINKEIF